ncbi:death-associated inhibitor of apoptosis 2 [Bactrocera tryoni]|uniref:death-associated inhibitor of apoptosis 2 n=1 Tax=Bactrocera tryoni TaxID=59916 RepID=UPI001A95B43A|nr:death-associated inhibitor of apoptosis 2 [Bactrocera tryoni]
MEESVEECDYLVEANRLATFKNWPNPNISPQSLAKAGFYYLNRSDQVKCAWCKGIIAMWEEQDDAFEEHKRFFPNCPRVQLGPLIEMASDGLRDLGIQQISTPKKPKFSSLDSRLRTYVNWPIPDIQKPDALAQAGLYYQNVEDQVRCFHCNIGLRSWQREDDPWFEHAKWFPQCQFVRLVKGANYIQHVQDLTRQSGHQPHNEISIDEAMMTAPVLQALEIGIDGGSIRNATQRQLLACGRPYETVEDLIKAVFGDPDDAEPIANGQCTEGVSASLAGDVSRLINMLDEAGVGSNCGESHNNANNSTTTLEQSNVENQVYGSAWNGPSCSAAVTNALQMKNTGDNTETAAKTDKADDACTNKVASEQTLNRTLSLEEENRKLKDARLCKVCLDEEVGVVFLPCGHLVTCVQCAPGVGQCPMCRADIKGFVRTYLS